MKNLFIIIGAAVLLSACGGSQTATKRPVANSNSAGERQSETVAVHSVDKERESGNLPKAETVEKSEEKSGWTRSGNPIDTTEFDSAIQTAEKAVKANAKDETANKNLAEAFYKRGFALTEARQYAAAIGDYRAALKYEPEHEESKKWIAVIAGIYKSMNRDIPKEGEEPKPLEFKKEKS
ncbi:MAG: tetratricopeptide repeat protein [Pyrinomonadaceae bacterium]